MEIFPKPPKELKNSVVDDDSDDEYVLEPLILVPSNDWTEYFITLINSADSGDINAQKQFINDLDRRKDKFLDYNDEKLLNYFKEKEEKKEGGFAHAFYAKMHQKGKGVTKDYVKAKKLYQQSKSLNCSIGYFGYAYLLPFFDANLFRVFCQTAIEKFSEKNGKKISFQEEEEEDEEEEEECVKEKRKKRAEKMIDLILKSIELSNFEAAYYMSCLLFDINYEKAFEYLSLAADQDHSNAIHKIAQLHHDGDHFPQNFQIAREMYEKNILQSENKHSLFNLGVMYHYGEGVDINYEKAKEFYIRAKNRGNCKAAVNMGIIGKKTGDLQFAKHYWKFAYLHKKDVLACKNLGELYRGEKKIRKAVKLLQISALGGDYEAQIMLRRMCFNVHSTEEEVDSMIEMKKMVGHFGCWDANW